MSQPNILGAARASGSSRRTVLAALLAAAILVVPSVVGTERAHAAAPPRDFMGVTSWGTLTDSDLARLADSNVRLYRMLVAWNKVEVRPPLPDGTHLYRWAYYDAIFRRAARHGVRILPILHGSPKWVAFRPQLQPRSEFTKKAFDDFAKAAAERYGPNGILWTRSPWSSTSPAPASVRPTYWQVWNEANTPTNWSPGPRPREYAAMVVRVSRALKQASPSVRVVAAGLVWPSRGMFPERYVATMLSVPGVRRAVDVFAFHPYAKLVINVMQLVGSARGTLNANGAAAKPMWITETGWATGTYDGSFFVSEAAQARNVDELYRKLLSVRRSYKLVGATWFSYKDRAGATPRNAPYAKYWGFYSGLLRRDGRPKPSWRVFSDRALHGY